MKARNLPGIPPSWPQRKPLPLEFVALSSPHSCHWDGGWGPASDLWKAKEGARDSWVGGTLVFPKAHPEPQSRGGDGARQAPPTTSEVGDRERQSGGQKEKLKHKGEGAKIDTSPREKRNARSFTKSYV